MVLAAQFCGAALGLSAVAQQASPATARKPVQSSPAAGFLGSFRAYAPGAAESRVSAFSGEPVPRYASLRGEKVNGRAGPSLDYPVEWAYSRPGLPVIVVRESQDWRKIRDPQGDEVWIKRNLLADQRTAMTMASGAIRKHPDDRAPAVADYHAGGVVLLGECQRDWCRVEAGDYRGWAPRDQLWGADDLNGG
jgi:SH3-like domain-containing protein